MSNRISKIVSAAAICASVLGVSLSGSMVAFAAGTGPNNALAPGTQWTADAPGQQTWYAFQYLGDSSQILVRMSVDTNHPASFEVWTPNDLQQWADGLAVTPVGQGTINGYMGNDLTWTGSFDTPGTYYVIVTDPNPAPANYSLQITGSGVSFGMESVQAVPAAAVSSAPAAPVAATTSQTAPAAAPAANAKPAAKSGMGPGDALSISGQWTPLAVGQQVWYAFQYPGDGSQVTIRMALDLSNAANFAVWTPTELMQSAQDSTIQPVGRGSVDDSLGGDLAWSGNFDTPGTYYVVVTQSGSVPANYQLTIN